MTKGQQHRIETQAIAGSVTVTIFGESIHNNKEAQQCAELLSGVLDALDYSGEYKVVASMQRLKGSSRLKGLSIHGVSINAVMLGYQPGGNDSRATYTLPLSNSEEAQECFVVMKAYVGTAYNGEVESKIESSDQPLLVPVAKVKPSSASPALPAKPISSPSVFYTKDAEWMETFILHLMELADSKPGKQVRYDQVKDLVMDFTHYEGRFGIGPILQALHKRGYLVEVEGKPDSFTVEGSPTRTLSKSKLRKINKPAKKSRAAPLKGYLSDEEWVRSCMEGMQHLVQSRGGLVTRTELNVFLKSQTNQKKIGGVVARVYEGLVLRGYIISEGDLLRVSYQPKPDTLEKAVEAIAQVRAETAKIFDGFAKYRLPIFAEGMFSNRQILDDFLRRVQEGLTKPEDVKNFLGTLYPTFSSWSYIQLLNYMCGRGYVIRLKPGKNCRYILGPKGREQLGLPAVDYVTVGKEASAVPVPVESVEVMPPLAAPVAEVTSVEVLALEQPKPLVSKRDGESFMVPVSHEEIVATALALSKATTAKTAAAQARARKETLQARRDELLLHQAEGPSPEAVQAAVMQRLIAMAHNL